MLGLVLHDQAATPWLAWTTANLLRPIGQLFLRAIFMIVVPMVFSALVIGVYELGRGHDLKGVAGRTLAFTVLLSTLSVAIGVALVNLIRPGDALRPRPRARPERPVAPGQRRGRRSVSQTIVELIPRNPLDSAVRALDGEMLPFMVFALIFGVAISAMPLKDDSGRSSSRCSSRCSTRACASCTS